jgi:hypothetical protein
VKRRSDQREHRVARLFGQVGRYGRHPALAHAGLADECDARSLERTPSCHLPPALQIRRLAVATDQRPERNTRGADALTDDLIVVDGFVDALDGLCGTGLELEMVAD